MSKKEWPFLHPFFIQSYSATRNSLDFKFIKINFTIIKSKIRLYGFNFEKQYIKYGQEMLEL